MFKRNLIVIWIGIIALGGMFFWGQSCTPLPCTDLDGDGYGNPYSTLCTYPVWDCNDGDPDIHHDAEDVCGNMIDDDCDGETDEGCAGATVKEYEILGTTISGTCDGMYSLLSCSDAESCISELGMVMSGSMEIEEQPDDGVVIQMPSLTGPYPVYPVFIGTRTGETFYSESPYSYVYIPCDISIYSTMSGGDILSDSFSGIIDVYVTISSNLLCTASNCVIESSYLAQNPQ